MQILVLTLITSLWENNLFQVVVKELTLAISVLLVLCTFTILPRFFLPLLSVLVSIGKEGLQMHNISVNKKMIDQAKVLEVYRNPLIYVIFIWLKIS